MATLQINHITFSRLSNAYHVQFFSNVMAGIEKYQIEKLGIDAETYARFTSAQGVTLGYVLKPFQGYIASR